MTSRNSESIMQNKTQTPNTIPGIKHRSEVTTPKRNNIFNNRTISTSNKTQKPISAQERALREIEQFANKLNAELREVIEYEEKKEKEREKLMQNSKEEEKNSLEIQFGIERAKASEKIMKISRYFYLLNSTKVVMKKRLRN